MYNENPNKFRDGGKIYNNRENLLVHLLLKCLLLNEENAQNFRKQHCCTTCYTVNLGLVSIKYKNHIGHT